MPDEIIDVGSLDRLLTVYDSSNIDQIAYCLTTKVMVVTYLSGGSYTYEDVHHYDFGDLCAADSVGKAFNILKEDRHWKETKIGG